MYRAACRRGEGFCPSAAEYRAASRHNEHAQGFVQKRRMKARCFRKGLKLGQTMRRRHLETPGQVCGVTIQFLVKKVAPSTDRLSQRNTGHGSVDKRQEFYLGKLGIEPDTKDAADNRPKDAEPPTARIQNVDQVRAEIFREIAERIALCPVRQDVVQACAEDTK